MDQKALPLLLTSAVALQALTLCWLGYSHFALMSEVSEVNRASHTQRELASAITELRAAVRQISASSNDNQFKVRIRQELSQLSRKLDATREIALLDQTPEESLPESTEDLDPLSSTQSGEEPDESTFSSPTPATSAASNAPATTVNQRFLDGYFDLQEADRLALSGNKDKAKKLYKKSLKVMLEIQMEAPNYQTDIINYRLQYIRDKLKDL